MAGQLHRGWPAHLPERRIQRDPRAQGLGVLTAVEDRVLVLDGLGLLPPQTDDELHATVEALFGVRIPRTSCCDDHTPPFTVFANAYFDREPVQVWKASRGFGGKSWLLGTLTATEAIFKAAQATILGGSASQSRNVHEVIHMAFVESEARGAPSLLSQDPTQYQTVLDNGAWIRALMASQRSVRGPHPQRLRMDEIDEMELGILEAALGQPMQKMRNGVVVPAQTILSSTHQYPDGTMTAILKRAAEQGWAIHHWCYRCNLRKRRGWLARSEVEAKRMLVPKPMWDAEYELQEPSFEGRAFTQEDLDAYFSQKKVTDDPGKELVFHEPKPHTHYVTGVDWAREKDWTIIDTFDTSKSPWQRVAWMRVNRMSYPAMVGMLNRRVKSYPGTCVYDATGLGSVITDYLDDNDYVKFIGYLITAASKSALFTDYMGAIEAGAFVSPAIEFTVAEHRYCRLTDLFGTKKEGHPPDSVVAPALAWTARAEHIELVGPAYEDFESSNYFGGTSSVDEDGPYRGHGSDGF